MADIKDTVVQTTVNKTELFDELDQFGIRLKGLEDMISIMRTVEDVVDYSAMFTVTADVIRQLGARLDSIKNLMMAGK